MRTGVGTFRGDSQSVETIRRWAKLVIEKIKGKKKRLCLIWAAGASARERIDWVGDKWGWKREIQTVPKAGRRGFGVRPLAH